MHGSFTPGSSPVPPDARPRLTVLSGPSGVGKSTVVAHMRKVHPEVWLSVSATTRKPRPGERHGVHYFFVDDEEFDKLVANGELLEWAEFAGNRYGTPRRAVLDRLEAGEPVLLEIDLQGARLVRESMPEALLVFLAPPSWDELVRRPHRPGDRGARGHRAPTGRREDRTGRRGGVRYDPGQHLRRGRSTRAASLDESRLIFIPLRKADVSSSITTPEGIINPPIDELLEATDSKYSLVIYAAKRARQINAYYSQLGEGLLEYVGPLVDTHVHEKPLSIALREINAGLLTSEAIEGPAQ